MPELTEWDSFYVIVGSSAGALIGLQFVVMTLVAEGPPDRIEEGGAAFASPNVVHFSSVLFLSALLCAPWRSIEPAAVLWGLLGLVGFAYEGIVVRRMQRQAAYRPVLEDWSFHAVLPWIGYAALVVSALVAFSHAHEALFGAGAASLVLLFVGIHNAWDAGMWHGLLPAQERNTD